MENIETIKKVICEASKNFKDTGKNEKPYDFSQAFTNSEVIFMNII